MYKSPSELYVIQLCTVMLAQACNASIDKHVFLYTSRLLDVFVHRVSVASTVITEQMCVKANPVFPVWNASDKKKQTSSHVDSALLRLYTRTNKDTSALKMVSSYLKGTLSIFISLLQQLQMQLIPWDFRNIISNKVLLTLSHRLLPSSVPLPLPWDGRLH